MPEFRGKRTTDERLRRIKDFSRLRMLGLLDTSITDEGIRLLAAATNLTEIAISSQRLTDACMETLCTLPALRSLIIHDAPFITDRGIAHLKKRDFLRELYLQGTHLSDKGVRSFTHITPIWSLSLNRTLVTDQGVSKLARLRNLSLITLEETAVVGYGLCDLPTPPTDIYLKGCPVTDDAVKKIVKHIRGLRRLSLQDTPITDECLPALAKLKKLGMLRLTGTKVTDKGVAHFYGHPSLFILEVGETLVSKKQGQRIERESPHEGMMVIH